MRGVRESGSSRRLPRASVLSNVCGSRDHGLKSRFGMHSGNCALSWIAGRPRIARRTFIGGYESSWTCSGKAQALCKNGHELEGQGAQLKRLIFNTSLRAKASRNSLLAIEPRFRKLHD